MLGGIIFIISIVLSLSWVWSGGMDYMEHMEKNRPDRKGEDQFEEGDN
jgi:hypothetical protein